MGARRGPGPLATPPSATPVSRRKNERSIDHAQHADPGQTLLCIWNRSPWNVRRRSPHGGRRSTGYFHPDAYGQHPVAEFLLSTLRRQFQRSRNVQCQAHYIQFFAGSTLIKEIRHVDFTGTLYRSDDLSKTIPYAGKFTRTFDPATNTIMITGLSAYTHPDGSGMLAVDPGRTVANPPAPPISDTGPTRIEWQMAVCAALAAE